jgi:hypothetical protein
MSPRDDDAMPSRIHDTLASPRLLQAGDKIRFVSPASDREE